VLADLHAGLVRERQGHLVPLAAAEQHRGAGRQLLAPGIGDPRRPSTMRLPRRELLLGIASPGPGSS